MCSAVKRSVSLSLIASKTAYGSAATAAASSSIRFFNVGPSRRIASGTQQPPSATMPVTPAKEKQHRYRPAAHMSPAPEHPSRPADPDSKKADWRRPPAVRLSTLRLIGASLINRMACASPATVLWANAAGATAVAKLRAANAARIRFFIGILQLCRRARCPASITI